jgi:hypothetical protein
MGRPLSSEAGLLVGRYGADDGGHAIARRGFSAPGTERWKRHAYDIVLSYKLYHTSGQVLHGIDIWSWGGLCIAVGRSAGYPNQEIAVKFAWMEPQ